MKLSVVDSAKPMFCKPWSVLLGLRDAFEQEFDQLLEAGEKVIFSEWEASIVAVMKDHLE